MISHHPHQSSRQDRVPANSRFLTAPLLWAFLMSQDPLWIAPDAISKEHTAPGVESGPAVPEPRKGGFYGQFRQANLMFNEDFGASLPQSRLLQRGGKSSLSEPKYRALEVCFDSRGALQLSLKMCLDAELFHCFGLRSHHPLPGSPGCHPELSCGFLQSIVYSLPEDFLVKYIIHPIHSITY